VTQKVWVVSQSLFLECGHLQVGWLYASDLNRGRSRQDLGFMGEPLKVLLGNRRPDVQSMTFFMQDTMDKITVVSDALSQLLNNRVAHRLKKLQQIYLVSHSRNRMSPHYISKAFTNMMQNPLLSTANFKRDCLSRQSCGQ
jgi:hypothetical protein